MARQLDRLTHKGVQAKDIPGYYADGGGLYMQASSAGTKSWIFRFTRSSKSREMGLGPLRLPCPSPMPEARLRTAAGCCMAGVDPIEARGAEKLKLRLDAS